MSSKSTTEQRDRLLNRIPEMLKSIGRDNFANAWLQSINELVAVDQFGILVFDNELKPKFICRATQPGQEEMGISSAQSYLKYFHYYDPAVPVLKSSSSGKATTVYRMRTADVPNEEYRKQVYERFNLRERISYLGHVGNTWYVVNLFRRAPNGLFSDQDMSLIDEFHEHFIGSAAHHISLVSPDIWNAGSSPQLPFLEELVGELGYDLSAREVDVCARALSGMTKNGIALDLDLKPPTVSTLTQRAYRKLNVSNLNEVFALCLRAMALRVHSPAP